MAADIYLKINNLISNFSAVNLRNFLRGTLKWPWADRAKITTKVDENIIEISDISNPKNNSHISIHKDDNKAVLRQGGIWIYEFSISSNDSFLSIETRTDRRGIDFMEMSFFHRCKEHLLVLLTNLKTQITKYNPSFDVLSKDEKFRKALEYLDNESGLS